MKLATAALVLTLAAQAHAITPSTPFIVDDFEVDQYTDGLPSVATGVGPFNATRTMYLQSGDDNGLYTIDESVNASLTSGGGELVVALGLGNVGRVRLVVEYVFPEPITFAHPDPGPGKFNRLLADFSSGVGNRPGWVTWYNGYTNATTSNDWGRQPSSPLPGNWGLYLEPHVWSDITRLTMEFPWTSRFAAESDWTYRGVVDRIVVINPEPTSVVLLLVGMAGLASRRRR